MDSGKVTMKTVWTNHSRHDITTQTVIGPKVNLATLSGSFNDKKNAL